MKKGFFLGVLTLCSITAWGEGYQVNTYSARQQGMGMTGVATPLGSESVIFNPGALAQMSDRFQISGSVSATSAHASATYDGVKYQSDNGISTPMNISAAFRIYDNFYGGISFFTPAGSGINWGENWPGAVLNQSVTIKAFAVQPTLSWEIIKGLSVGAGVSVNWGNVDLNKALMTGSSLNRLLAAQGVPQEAMYAPEVAPASVNLNGKSGLAVGWTAGALWQINKRWSIGAMFRSKTTLKVAKGAAAVSYNGIAEQMLAPVLDNLNHTNFSASLPEPYVFTAGVAFRPDSRWLIEADVQLNGWGAYKTLDIEFAELESFNQHLTKNYHNAMTYKAGAQFSVTRRLDVRAGLMVDCSPCDINHYNPETPAQTRVEPAVGFSFKPLKGLSIDFSFMYVHGCGVKNGTGQYDDMVYKIAEGINPGLAQVLGLSPQGTFKADYKVHAFIPALGLSYSF
ncbi:MAG: outer membrane protein transport protein [Muribaculaceae bacterium]|nr:outer membrane protein transport protein [Muribaculaceae bacterium]